MFVMSHNDVYFLFLFVGHVMVQVKHDLISDRVYDALDTTENQNNQLTGSYMS